jgi:hypothetical protein
MQPLNLFQHRSQNSVELLMDKTARAREDMWQQIGSLQPLVLSHMVNSALLGGPKWPALRQAFRVIRRHNSGNIILATDGLSDPFDDTLDHNHADAGDNVNGFGLEFYIETTVDEMADTIDDVKRSWQFQLLYTVSQLAAGHGGIRAILDDMKLLSTEAEGVSEAIPEALRDGHVNAAGRVGALLGLRDTQSGIPEFIQGMPLSEVRLVNIKLLTLEELQLITDQGAEGRRKLDSLFKEPDRLWSQLRRGSVV